MTWPMLHYNKKPKIPEKFAVIILKVEQFGFTIVLCPEDSDGMANNVDL